MKTIILSEDSFKRLFIVEDKPLKPTDRFYFKTYDDSFIHRPGYTQHTRGYYPNQQYSETGMPLTKSTSVGKTLQFYINKLNSIDYKNDALEEMFNNAFSKTSSEEDKYKFFSALDGFMGKIKLLLENTIEKITHKHKSGELLDKHIWYVDPNYMHSNNINLDGYSPENKKKIEDVVGKSTSFYQCILVIYQNPVIWNYLFFDEKYKDVKDLYFLCVKIAKGTQIIPKDVLNAIRSRKLDGSGSNSEMFKNDFTSPLWNEYVEDLTPKAEISEISKYWKNKENAKPEFFYSSVFGNNNNENDDFTF